MANERNGEHAGQDSETDGERKCTARPAGRHNTDSDGADTDDPGEPVRLPGDQGGKEGQNSSQQVEMQAAGHQVQDHGPTEDCGQRKANGDKKFGHAIHSQDART